MVTVRIKACEEGNISGANYTSCSKDEREGEKKPEKTTVACSFFIKFSHVSQTTEFFQLFQLT